MKLGCSSQSFDSAFQQSETELLAWADYCAETLELDGIEIEDKHFPSREPEFLRQLKQQIALRQLTLSSLTISNNFGLPTSKEREGQLDYLRTWLEVARALGSPQLRIFAGWPQPPSDVGGWRDMIECLKRSCVAAEEAGVLLALENHNHSGFVQVGDDALRLFQEVGSKWLRLNLDTGNYLDGLASIEKTLPWAVHVHAKLSEIAPDGSDRVLNYAAILALLKRGGYGGFLSLEYEGRQDPFEVIPLSVGYFRQLLSAS